LGIWEFQLGIHSHIWPETWTRYICQPRCCKNGKSAATRLRSLRQQKLLQRR
jgi:hypothetical protein